MRRRRRDFKAEWEAAKSETAEREQKPPRMCAVPGKRMYASEAEAKATATHRMRDKDAGAAQLRVYRCIYCKAWHLTSKER